MAQSAQASVATANAKRYLGQFAKHFAHKLPVVLDPGNEAATVPFPMGMCRLTADDAMLRIAVESDSQDGVTRLRDIVSSHLVRFAFREDIALAWQIPG